MDELAGGTGSGPIVLPVFTAPTPPAGVAAVPPGALTRLFDLVRELKENNAYTEAIGLDLGIVASESPPCIRAPASRSPSSKAGAASA